jgi:hypothetical protein
MCDVISFLVFVCLLFSSFVSYTMRISFPVERYVSVYWVNERDRIAQRYLSSQFAEQCLDEKTRKFRAALREIVDGKRIVVPVEMDGRVVAYAKVFPELPGTKRSFRDGEIVVN